MVKVRRWQLLGSISGDCRLLTFLKYKLGYLLSLLSWFMCVELRERLYL